MPGHSVIKEMKGKENFKSLEQGTRVSELQMVIFSESSRAFHSCYFIMIIITIMLTPEGFNLINKMLQLPLIPKERTVISS